VRPANPRLAAVVRRRNEIADQRLSQMPSRILREKSCVRVHCLARSLM
jgi:hypothetical protein